VGREYKYVNFAWPSQAVFDKDPESGARSRARAGGVRRPPEDERIALRCNRKELQLLDSFVANGEFDSRSELMRAALHEFLRNRTIPAVKNPPADPPTGANPVPVYLRPDEVETFRTYGDLLANGQALGDVLAQLVRRGALELKVSELVASARVAVRQAMEERSRFEALEKSGRELERKGFLGR
jgi:hypothetical protein